LSYCPRSSLPADVLAWLAARLLPSRPPGQGGTPPLCLEVRLDAVAAVLPDGLSYRRAGRMVGISKTEVGDSLDLLLGPLAALGYCQPDGTFVASLDDLRQLLAEIARCGEAVVVDELATRVQRPRGWANQKALYDAKRHAHTAQGLAVSTIWGDLLWVDGGWPGSCHEHELLAAGGAGPRARRRRGRQPTGPWIPLAGQSTRALGMRRSGTAAPRTASATPSGRSTACRRGCGRWWSSRCPSGRRLGAASLARAAVPSPGYLPGRGRADLPWPLAAPSPYIKSRRWPSG
jgi:hypothetical protein